MYDTAKHVWLNPAIEYIFNTDIIEYDIRDAGFSIIKQYHLLPEQTIRKLAGMEKGLPRHKAIGIMERDDKQLAQNLSQKFGEVRKLFIDYNKINPDNDIISVKKDAIFMIGTVKKTTFGQIEFRPKNTYTSYLRFPNITNLELYYKDNWIDVKGIGDNTVGRHRLYMFDFLRTVIKQLEEKNPSVKRYMMNFIMQYKAHELEDLYYLEFNSLSKDFNPLYNYQNILIPLVELINKEIQ